MSLETQHQLEAAEIHLIFAARLLHTGNSHASVHAEIIACLWIQVDLMRRQAQEVMR